MSRIEAGEAKLEEGAVDLPEAFADCLEMLRPRSQKKRLQMETQVDPNLPQLRADKRMVKQMVLHLLTNAVTFTPDGGTVALSAGTDGEGRITVAIRDTGIGMSKADLARAIEPFHTVERPQARSFQGVGLGLPLTRSMVELHGGSLTLDSEPNAGTLATLTFPASRTIADAA
jgi:signal transduction histidine kinase